ncbi:oxidoreductase [Klebsiella pneumoniae]|uniref:Oxidoreductase n=1 Tax=Klebsiella pneumoniae TaxID=573 RepID=A0A377UV68_KLEPN|nr:oxidoreductase [Klebsiella pneumoniae]
MAHLLRHRKLSEGVTLLLDERLTAILRTHAAVSVIGHGLVRGAGLGGPLGAALNSVKAVSGSAYRVTHPRGPAYCLFTANAPAAVRHRGNW